MELTGAVMDLLGSAWTIIAFLAALMVIVAVHELGHYWVGRWCGIHATTFSLGFGTPLIRRRDRHGTLWQISLLPLGGYVKFLGDGDGASARADDATMAQLSSSEKRHTLHGAPLIARMLTVAAGPAANILLTALIVAGALVWNGVALEQPVVGVLRAVPNQEQGLKPGDTILAVEGQATPDQATFFDVTDALPPVPRVTYRVLRDGQEMDVTDSHPRPPVVLDVQPKSAALDAGLQAGDVVMAMDGVPIATFNQMPPLVEAKAGAPVRLTIWRAGQTFDVDLTPRRRDLPDGKGGFETRWLVGLTGGSLFEPATRHPGPIETISLSAQATWALIATNVSGIAHILSGAISSCNLSGPIGMAEVVGQAARSGVAPFVEMVAIISLGIGLTNLLPIPVLDGGHLVFHLYEAVTRRPPSRAVLHWLTLMGFAVILGLMLFAISNDLTCS